jgi:hypothetical protein
MKIDQKPAIVRKSVKNADDQLADYLRIAEDALIGAVKLLSGQSKPLRRESYCRRLNLAQETITSLYREELVRIRGPIRIKKKL